MAFSYHDVTIIYALTASVSVALFLLRVAQQVNLRRRRSLKRADLFGSFFFLLSTVVICTTFILRQIDIVGKAKAGDTTYIQNGIEITYGLRLDVNKRNFVEALINPLALWLIKFSYLCTYCGVASHMTPGLKVALKVITAYMITSYIAILLVQFLWCRPLWILYTFTGEYTKCFDVGFWDTTPFSVLFALTLTTDIALVVFSILLVRSIRAARENEGWAILVLFLMGCMSIVSSIVRYYYIHALTTNVTASDLQQLQFSLSFTFWQVMEILFATISYGLTSARAYLRYVVSSLTKARYMVSKRSQHGRRYRSANALSTTLVGDTRTGGAASTVEMKNHAGYGVTESQLEAAVPGVLGWVDEDGRGYAPEKSM